MADDNDNIFEAGNSGPTGNAENPADGNGATGDSIEGRIDPAVARAASGENGSAAAAPGNTAANTPGGNAPGNSAGEQPAKRGRGRPRKDAASGTGGTTEDKTRDLVPATSEVIAFIHEILAEWTKTPELSLEDGEYKEIGRAVDGVLEHSAVRLTKKQRAYLNLARVVNKIYVPTVGAVVIRKRMEYNQRKKTAPQNPAAPQPAPKSAPNVTPIRMKPDAKNAAEELFPAFDPTKITIPDGSREG